MERGKRALTPCVEDMLSCQICKRFFSIMRPRPISVADNVPKVRYLYTEYSI